MREIEFRGKIKNIPDYFGCSKDKNDGEWVYGDLECHRIDELVRIHCYREDKKYYRQYDVDPNTVGQFTGLLDKNGKKIFEGDIIRFVNGQKKVNGEWVDNEFIYTIEYSEGAFRGVSGLSKALGAVEVIGNIHDTPELLENK